MDWTDVWNWTASSWKTLPLVFASTLGVYLLIIAYTRAFGLRSFSKMSSFDFAATVAVGSLMATTIVSPSPSLVQGAAALLSLYVLQRALAWMRQRSDAVAKIVDNDPILLMAGETILEENLKKTGITRSDLRSKLREANVLTLAQVRAVVLETTGDISVLHGDADGPELEMWLLEGVTDAHLLRGR